MGSTFRAESRPRFGSRIPTRSVPSLTPCVWPRLGGDGARRSDSPGRRSVRRLRRAVRARDPDGRAQRARGHVAQGQGRHPVPARARRSPARVCRPANAPICSDPIERALRRRAHPSQARGPVPHRRSQAQQRGRPSAARDENGQKASDRGNGRRPAWRGGRDGEREVWSRMHRYMGTEDMRRQSMNVGRMKLLGAEVVEVKSGTKTLKDATSEAIRDWVTNVLTTHYIIGSVVGPHPYPELVRDLQRVIGDEAREQYLSVDGKLPDAVVACVGGGSNAIGMFTAFLDDKDVALIGVEAAGEGVRSGKHAASLVGGRPGVLHGSYSYVLQDGDGQILPTHSVSAGLDYP